MTIANNINFVCTVISIIVTIISTVCTVWTFHSAKKVTFAKNMIDLSKLTISFADKSLLFQEQTRTKNWYKGLDINTVISPFSCILTTFGEVYHLFDKKDNLEKKVHELNKHIQHYDRASSEIRNNCDDLIIEILDILNAKLHANK